MSDCKHTKIVRDGCWICAVCGNCEWEVELIARAKKAEAELEKSQYKRRNYADSVHVLEAELKKVEAELAEVKQERDYLRDKYSGKISSLEEELNEMSEENQQLVADNRGYRDQIDLLTKECIEREALELSHIDMIKTLTADRDHWQRRACLCETRQAARSAANKYHEGGVK